MAPPRLELVGGDHSFVYLSRFLHEAEGVGPNVEATKLQM